MGRSMLITALAIAAVFPLIFGIGYGLSFFMPECQWAASAPAGGCVLLGVNLNWLITFSTVAFVGSFFSVPIGFAVAIVGLIAKVVNR